MVKRVQRLYDRKNPDVAGDTRRAGWQPLAWPQPGSDTPNLTLHFWAEPFTQIFLGIQVVIEGPRGKDPYIEDIR